MRKRRKEWSANAHLQGPLPNLGGLHHKGGGREVFGEGQVQLGAARHELPRQQHLSELLVEGAQVAQEAAGQQAVPCNLHDHKL